ETSRPHGEERTADVAPSSATVQRPRPSSTGADPAGVPRVQRDRRALTRGVDREDLRIPEPVHLREEEREEAVEGGEASEEEEDAQQVRSKRSREAVSR